MHDKHEEITDTLELAHRINSSTDIVTAQEGTIDSQQQTIDQTIVQAKDEIIEAFEHLTPGLVPIIEKIDQSTEEIMIGITGIAQKIDNIDFTPVEEKLDEIEGELMQGVTGLNQAVDEIKELISGVTGYAQEDTLVQGITSIRADVSELREEIGQGFSGVGEKIDQDFTGLGNELVQGLSGLSNEILQGNSGILQDISEVKDLVSGVTGYAQQDTLVQGLTGLTQKIDILQGSDDEADLTSIKNNTETLLLEVAKQGSSSTVTLTGVDEKIGDLNDIIESINGDTVDNIVNDYIGEQVTLIDDMIGDWSSSDNSND